jgi:hypothetical protein
MQIDVNNGIPDRHPTHGTTESGNTLLVRDHQNADVPGSAVIPIARRKPMWCQLDVIPVTVSVSVAVLRAEVIGIEGVWRTFTAQHDFARHRAP